MLFPIHFVYPRAILARVPFRSNSSMHWSWHVTGCARLGSYVLGNDGMYDELGARRRRFIERLEDCLLEHG